MTPNKAIERVSSVAVDVYDDENKLAWISELDGLVTKQVIEKDEFVPYSYPEDMDKELLVPAPFDGVYEAYIISKINLHNGEYTKYNASATVFHDLFMEYKKEYLRENVPKMSEEIRF